MKDGESSKEEMNLSDLQIHRGIRLHKSDEKFVLFLRRASHPITEDAIAQFYAEYVMRMGSTMRHGWHTNKAGERVVGWYWDDWDEETIRKHSLTWFDRSLGRAIRKQIIPSEAKAKLTLQA